jgi:glutathione S-transferase
MTIKLYTDVGSGSCRRVNAVVNHLGIDVEQIKVDLLAGENHADEFLSLSPSGMVPVLVDSTGEGEDTVLTEASAIMIYLCENYSTKAMLETGIWPTGTKRYQVTKWMFWAAEHFRQSAPIYFEEKVIAHLLGNEENIHRIREADRMLNRFAPLLDSHLSGRDYVVGNQLTLADFDLAAALSQISRTLIPYEKYQNIIRWEKNLTQNIAAWRTTGRDLNNRMNAALSKA